MDNSSPSTRRRAGYFICLLLLVSLVGDGWSGRPGPLTHQLLLVPVTVAFCWASWNVLFSKSSSVLPAEPFLKLTKWLIVASEVVAVGLIWYEKGHFSAIGYHLPGVVLIAAFLPAMALLIWVVADGRTQPLTLLLTALAVSSVAFATAIVYFPLTYLRSDMLPVILGADQHVLHGASPYAVIAIGPRLYDFPYLPGMIAAFLPFAWAHVDLRIGSFCFLVATVLVVYFATKREARMPVAVLVALFVLSPFLQYRHELYLQPHWLMLMASFVLMQRGRHLWAALVFGFGMATYQFSWILFPFALLLGLRRAGCVEVIKLAAVAAMGAAMIYLPFARTPGHQSVGTNAVGQWSRLTAPADVINLSYWVTFAIAPAHLLWLQAALMVGIFAYCFFGGRCADLADTLRWSVVALTAFILLNVIIDGYFYLMLLVLLLAYVCVANGWWKDPAAQRSGATITPQPAP